MIRKIVRIVSRIEIVIPDTVRIQVRHGRVNRLISPSPASKEGVIFLIY